MTLAALRNSALALLLYLGACSPVRPRVSLAPGASLKGYHVVVVRPVRDQTGAPFNLDVSDSLRQALIRRLESHGLPVVDDSAVDPIDPALVVASTLVDFRGMPSWLQVPQRGTTACELHAELSDYQTGKRLGSIAAADLGEEYTPLFMLVRCAHAMADAIDRQVKQ